MLAGRIAARLAPRVAVALPSTAPAVGAVSPAVARAVAEACCAPVTASASSAAAPLDRRWVSTSSAAHGDDLSPLGHDHSDMTNTEDHAFDFTDANYKVVERILGKYPANYKKSATIPLLDLAQRQCGNFLPLAAMQKVARLLGISEIEVFEVATFYTMFNRKRVGKFFIQLCGTTPCMVNGSEEIKATIESELDIHTGETTSDGLFTLLEVECLGACVNAPMIQINDDFYECLTPESTKAILAACREQGAPPRLTKWGSKPMNGQSSCEGPMGKTTLQEMPAVPTPRELPRNIDPSTIKQEMMY